MSLWCEMNTRVTRIYVAGSLIHASRSAYIPILAWFVTETTGRPADIGLVLIWFNILSMLVAPYIGKLVDASNRKVAIVVGEAVSGTGFAAFGLLAATSTQASLEVLMGFACWVSLGSLTSMPAFYGMLRERMAESEVKAVAVRLSAIVSIVSTAAVAVAGGLISVFGVSVAFLLCSGFAAACALTVLGMPRITRPAPAGPHSDRGVRAGLSYILASSVVLVSTILMATTFAAGQLTNVSLAPLIRNELSGNGFIFGVVEAAWAAGAIVGSVLLARLSHRIDFGIATLAPLVSLIGGILVLIPQMTSFVAIGVTHAIIGVIFGLARSQLDALIIANSRSEFVGRVRNGGQALIGFTGLLVFLSPSVFSAGVIEMYVWGGLSIAAIGLSLTALSLVRMIARI